MRATEPQMNMKGFASYLDVHDGTNDLGDLLASRIESSL